MNPAMTAPRHATMPRGPLSSGRTADITSKHLTFLIDHPGRGTPGDEGSPMRMRTSTRLAAVGAAVALAAVGATAVALSTGTAQAADSTGALPDCPFWASGITPPARSDTPFTHPL